MFLFTGISSVIAVMKDYVGNKQEKENKRSVFEHPDSALQLNQELKIFFLAIHIKAEQKDKQMKCAKYRVENQSVSLHHKGMDWRTNLAFFE